MTHLDNICLYSQSGESPKCLTNTQLAAGVVEIEPLEGVDPDADDADVMAEGFGTVVPSTDAVALAETLSLLVDRPLVVVTDVSAGGLVEDAVEADDVVELAIEEAEAVDALVAVVDTD